MTDLDLKLNTRIYENIDLFKKKKDSYKSRVSRSRTFLQKAKEISKKDLQEKLNSFKKGAKPVDAIVLMRNLFNSGTWIGQSSLRYFLSLIDFTNHGDSSVLTPEQAEILTSVRLNKNITNFSDEDIFKTIYNEMEYSQYFPDHNPLIKVESLDCTIVLIPGVFNELFSTPAFERAAQHLHHNYGIKYFCPKVSGIKSCEHNSKLLERQLKAYIRRNPNEKLWLVCYSKGGLDSLHFLAKNQNFAENHILGISTIATPIMGTEHLRTGIFKTLNAVNSFGHKTFSKLSRSQKEVFSEELQNSISATFRRPWLRNNQESLSPKLFYTAIGFESEWFDSHLWMILTKGILKSRTKNDGVVDAENSLFPSYFENGKNLGIIRGHHLVGSRSSYFCQEALLEAHIIYLKYKNLIS